MFAHGCTAGVPPIKGTLSLLFWGKTLERNKRCSLAITYISSDTVRADVRPLNINSKT